MPQIVHAFSGFSVDDQAAAKQFYGDTLNLPVTEDEMGLRLQLPGDEVFIYAKPDHTPATFTVLNLVVADIDAAIEELAADGIVFEQYNDPAMPQDAKGVLRGRSAHMGPDIAWFKDPAGNILSVLQS
jgi:catechol 2,3-dioxygenase-like lactoylglutathione lyase family enzyme